MIFTLLAQTTVESAPAVAAVPPLWHVLINNAFGLTMLFIFLTAIITVIVQQRRKDKCLKLMHDYHISYLKTDGSVSWGDLIVFSKGLELLFDAPYRTQRGIFKTSSIFYEADMAHCLAIYRCLDALTAKEQRQRRRQIRRSFKPGLIRKTLRSFRNIINTLRDAFSQALTSLIGQLAKTSTNTAVTQQKSGVEKIGQTLLGAAGNAYEQVLEKHIGRPVIVELTCPVTAADQPPKRIDLPGYLVDYTDKYLAIFNVEQEPLETVTLKVTQDITLEGYSVQLTDRHVTIHCTGADLMIVRSVRCGQQESILEVALSCGAHLEMARDPREDVTLTLQRTRRIDVVCSRKHAIIHFGGQFADEIKSREHGLAPSADSPETQIDGG